MSRACHMRHETPLICGASTWLPIVGRFVVTDHETTRHARAGRARSATGWLVLTQEKQVPRQALARSRCLPSKPVIQGIC